MYGQKTSLGVVSSGVTVASWWMLGVTITLSVVAIILLGRALFQLRSRDASRRP